MIKRFVLTAVVALLVLAAIFGYKFHTINQAKAAAAARKPQPIAVTSAEVTQDNWQTKLSAVGDIESSRGITVRSEIEGRIVKVAFDSGATVKEGDLLVELDTASEEAQLHALEARAQLAKLTLERQAGLRENNTNTQAELDAAQAAAAEAAANVEGIKATLAKKRIVAPFSGRLGIRLVNTGQFINKADAIVGLESLTPIYADFSLPQQDLAQLKVGFKVQANVDTFPGRVFEGKVEAINPRITSDTRNVRVRAVLPNEDEALKPGMFARVDVLLPGDQSVSVLPSTAVVSSPYGDSVFVITDSGNGGDGRGQLIAEQRFVRLGAKRGDLISVISGLKPGERVVTSGQVKLRNKAPVQINNTVVPSSSANPKPSES
jgi:membrane fusion protein, multidrug efflux system